MRLVPAAGGDDPQFDEPPRFQSVERRMAGMALDAWEAGGRRLVPGFDAHSLTIACRDDAAVIASIGAPLAAAFGLAAGMPISGAISGAISGTASGGDGLMGELRAVCDLIALRPEPVPFEASLMAPDHAAVLVRGVGLPIMDGAGEPGPERLVQIVVNWREVLDRAATARLRRELAASLQVQPQGSVTLDAFAAEKP